MPGAKSQGTLQSYDFCAAGRPEAIAEVEGTQFVLGPVHRTRLIVTPSVGCD